MQQSNISQDGGVAALVSYFILLIFDFSLSLALCGDSSILIKADDDVEEGVIAL
jgi:hypothetical protein